MIDLSPIDLFPLSTLLFQQRSCDDTYTRFEPLSCVSSKRLRASIKMSNLERKYSPVYRHIICIGKTKSTGEKGLLSEFVFEIKNRLKDNFAVKLNSFLLEFEYSEKLSEHLHLLSFAVFSYMHFSIAKTKGKFESQLIWFTAPFPQTLRYLRCLSYLRHLLLKRVVII